MAKDNSDEQKTERFNMFMSPSEMKAIDDWAWKNRVRSKSEAVRRLVQSALRIDDEIEQIYKHTHSLHQAILTQSEIVAETLDPGNTDWERVGKTALAVNTSLVEDISKLTLAINSIIEQVHQLRSDGELVDLSKAADEIKAAAKHRARLLKLSFNASKDGDFEEDEVE